MKKLMNCSTLIAVVGLSLLGAAGCSADGAEGASSKQPEAQAEIASGGETTNEKNAAEKKTELSNGLSHVTDRSLICMMNNQYMGQPQIPIEVEGRTYFGCCEMCKTRLGSDASTRNALDPVSGKTVDKATAVIAKTQTGKALYFENEQNMAAYRGQGG